MGVYDDLLNQLGLIHLKDNPEELREAILKELGLTKQKSNPELLRKSLEDKLEKNRKKLQQTSDELGKLMQNYVMKNNN